MIIEVAEWGSIGTLELTAAQVSALAQSDAFRIQPDPSSPSRWQISATQRVGVAHLADLQIKVTPKVPTHRLLELLCTSIDRIQWDERNTQWGEQTDLLATIAESFVSQTEQLVRHGLLQGYVTVEEGMFGVRGRVDIGRQIKRNPGLALPVEVTYDDYTTDIVENQLLAGAGRLLLRLSSLPSSISSRLRRFEYELVDITPTPPSPNPPQVTWTRLNQRYGTAVTLARLILRGSALAFEDTGSTRGDSFLVDMNQVFEDVVGQGVRAALQTRGFTTHLQREDRLDLDRQITIRPDVRVDLGSAPVAVADIKYKRPSASGVANDDVYQALAYATRYGLSECTLIFAEKPPVDRVRVGDVTVHFEWIDLNQPPAKRVESLVRLAAKLSRSSTSEFAASA
jgi:5-methylcytosine-specific restriction enzyme subunit McrC